MCLLILLTSRIAFIVLSINENPNKALKFSSILLISINEIPIRDNLTKIPKPYVCIQIRNTDYKCNYDDLILENKDTLEKFDNIFLATDDKNACMNLKNVFKKKIHCFTNFPSENYHNLHRCNLSGDMKIKDLLSDLFLMAMSEKIISNSKGGYIQLAQSCFDNKHQIFNKI